MTRPELEQPSVKSSKGSFSNQNVASSTKDPLSQSLPAQEIRKLKKFGGTLTEAGSKCVYDQRMFHDEEAEKDYFEIMTNMDSKVHNYDLLHKKSK